MILYLVLLFCFCNTVFTSDGVKSYKGYKIYKVKGDQKGLDRLEKSLKNFTQHFLIERIRHNRVTVLQALVAPESTADFEESVKKQKLDSNLVFDDLSKIIIKEKAHQGEEFSWSAYYDIDYIYGYVKNTSAKYPKWTKLVKGGKSYEGRYIQGLRINTPEGGAKGKPAVFIESGVHGREWITPAATTYFINQLLTSDNPDIVALRNQFDWHIFPSINPDGYHFSYTMDRIWRKSRSKSANGCYGVDLNSNWDYHWKQNGKLNDPCDYQSYIGTKPFSEIETRTLSKYISGIENLLGYIAFHADSQLLLVPYADSKQHCDNYDDLITIGKTSIKYGYQVNGAQFGGPATAAEILQNVSGTSADWVRSTLRTVLVYTYELRSLKGEGTFYWPPDLIYQQGDEVTQMLLGLFKEARNLGYYK